MFCPYCANLLVVEPFDGAMRFACKTCPYHYNIGKRLKKAAHIEQKKVDDVLGDGFANAATADVIGGCPKCGHNKAYFFTVQIRSADEPATRFYRCASKAVEPTSTCVHSWSENV